MSTVIDLTALRHNAICIKERSTAKLCAVVKADAYGHGMENAAEALSGIADYYAVANSSEAVKLARFSGTTPILQLGCADEAMLPSLEKAGVILSVNSADDIALLKRSGLKFEVHVKLDSGMHRLGFPCCELEDALKMIGDAPNLKCGGIYTHFARADTGDCEAQHYSFIDACGSFKDKYMLHCANSSATAQSRKYHHDMLRCGLACYGYIDCGGDCMDLRQVMRAYTEIVAVNTVPAGEYVGYGSSFMTKHIAEVAVLACGYADGLPRSLSNCGKVLINNCPCNIIGNVCMDMTFADVSGLRVKRGDRADIICKAHSALDLAREAGTIPYEILTGFACRARRITE